MLEAFAKGAEYAGRKLGEMVNTVERLDYEKRIKAYGTKVADEVKALQAQLRVLRHEEITEQDIISSKTLNSLGKRIELQKIVSKKLAEIGNAEKNARDAANLESYNVEIEIDNKYKASKIQMLEGIAKAEAEINARADEERAKTGEITSYQGRRAAQQKIEEIRTAALEKIRADEKERIAMKEVEASQVAEKGVKKWVDSAVAGWRKLNEQAQKYVNLVQGLGGDTLEEALFNSMGGATMGRGGAAFNPGPQAIAAGARGILNDNPSLSSAGWDVQSLSRIMQELLDVTKKNQDF
jgi:hypothetical protein